MYSFFVLGIIPGTNFQITFGAWTNIAAALAIVVLLITLRRVHGQKFAAQYPILRQPLHASRLHLRGQ
jgi:uncharacterized protein (DUF983 family)